MSLLTILEIKWLTDFVFIRFYESYYHDRTKYLWFTYHVINSNKKYCLDWKCLMTAWIINAYLLIMPIIWLLLCRMNVFIMTLLYKQGFKKISHLCCIFSDSECGAWCSFRKRIQQLETLLLQYKLFSFAPSMQFNSKRKNAWETLY